MAFKNKATESKLQSLSTVGLELFHGKYFDVLHTSAENIRDAKETPHLSSSAKDSFGKKRKFQYSNADDKRHNQGTASKVSKSIRTEMTRGLQNRRSKDRRQNYRGNNADKSTDGQQSGFRTPK